MHISDLSTPLRLLIRVCIAATLSILVNAQLVLSLRPSGLVAAAAVLEEDDVLDELASAPVLGHGLRVGSVEAVGI